MTKIKSYTDIEQSKKLAEILPLDSADMGLYYSSNPNAARNQMWVGTKAENADIPCWSLAALLNVIPNNENISTNLSKGGFRISTLKYTDDWFVDYEDESDGLNNCVTSADNPVDACYEMILKLHELILL